jgi:hypothetical protein
MLMLNVTTGDEDPFEEAVSSFKNQWNLLTFTQIS